jgi:hypothetical protein
MANDDEDARPPAWPRRLLQAIPPMSDGLWAGFFLAMVFTCGVIVGLTLRVAQTDSRIAQGVLEQQLQRLEQRVRVLEER